MKDELNCSYNGGGVAYLLQIVAIHINHTVLKRIENIIRTYIPTESVSS